jgi:hypothetical protein
LNLLDPIYFFLEAFISSSINIIDSYKLLNSNCSSLLLQDYNYILINDSNLLSFIEEYADQRIY